MPDITSLGPEASRAYAAGQKIKEESHDLLTHSAQVARSTQIDQVVDLPSAILTEVGVGAQAPSWAHLPVPHGYGGEWSGLFGVTLGHAIGDAGALGDLWEQVNSSVEEIAGRLGAGGGQEQVATVLRALDHLCEMSGLHEDVRLQLLEYVKG